jgi:hypothetical protein
MAISRDLNGAAVERKGLMGRIGQVIIIVVVLAIAGGVAFLATRDIPAPSAQVVKVIPNDKALHP